MATMRPASQLLFALPVPPPPRARGLYVGPHRIAVVTAAPVVDPLWPAFRLPGWTSPARSPGMVRPS